MHEIALRVAPARRAPARATTRMQVAFVADAAPPPLMRAFIYDFAAPSGMSFTAAHPRPTAASLRAGELLVAVRAAALNPIDYKKPGLVPLASYILARTPVGQDFAGVVLASAAPGFAAGDAVFGTAEGARGGCLAEALIARAADCAPLPRALSFAHGAALVTAAMTSIQALERGGARAGSRVLVIGASGGVGSVGVQVARAVVGPAGGVAAVCGAAAAPLARSLGADAVADYGAAGDALAPLRALPRFDVVFDTVSSGERGDDLRGVPYAAAAAPLLAPGGRVVAINGTVAQWARALLCGACCAPRAYTLFMQQPDGAALARAAAWAEAGALRAVIDGEPHAFDAAGCEAAYARLRSRRAKGKVVVAVQQ